LVNVPDTDLVYYAFQNYPGQTIDDRFIDPRVRFVDAIELDPVSPKGFGDNGILPTFNQERPDVLFIYNDIAVCDAILKLVSPAECKVVLFLDLVYPWEDINRFEYLRTKVDLCYVMTNSWKTHMVHDLGWESDKILTLHLGTDIENIPAVDSKKAKAELGFKETDFIVLNLNRNSYRKQWCVTIKAWFKFWMDNGMSPDIKLFVGCSLITDDGYDIYGLIKIECMKHNLDFDLITRKHIFINSNPTSASDTYVRRLYAACDVGVNTCCGEGYGLISIEHALYGKPQIVSGLPSTLEVCEEVAIFVEPELWTSMSRFESHGGEIAVFDYTKFADALGLVYNNKHTPVNLDFIKRTCDWNSNLKVLDAIYL
jgi:hypothetical protein